jgi:exodeoxyribonuclease VII small subunit
VAQLEGIVEQLERGDVALDKSIEIYERGEALKAHCEKLLSAAEKGSRRSGLTVRASRQGRNRSTPSRNAT